MAVRRGGHVGGSQRRWAAGYARLVVRLRWAVVVGWAVAVWAFTAWLPDAPGSIDSGVDGLLPAGSAAIQTEIRSFDHFPLPLLSRTAIVQRDPDGLEVDTQAEAADRAVRLARGELDGADPILAAIPAPNTFALFPGSREAGTTIVTWVFTPPNVGFGGQYAAAERFTERFYDADDDVVGVTGSVPARLEQGGLLREAVPTVEAVTLVVVLAIVAMVFRSVLVPLVTLAVAGVGAVATIELAAALGALAGLSVPAELEPLLVALLLGIATDYVVFFVSGMRSAITDGVPARIAAEMATARFAPIVAVAGLTVAAGTACLVVAESSLFRAFGPGMALTVLVGLVVAGTLAPALMAILAPWLFWPSRPRPAGQRPAGDAAGDDAAGERAAGHDLPRGRSVGPVGGGWLLRLTQRRYAAWVLVAGVLALTVAAAPLRQLDLGLAFVPSLPADNEVRQAAAAAKQGFADGILSPTMLLVEGDDIAEDRPALARLGRLLAGQPGVAGVLGPGDQPLSAEYGVVLARSGDAARYLIVFADEPLGGKAIDSLGQLRDRMPALLGRAGVPAVRTGFAGDTAIAEAVVASSLADLERIALAALAVNLLLLVLFLRALVAPLALLAVNVLTLLATLGLTTAVFQGVAGHDGLTFYVPFAAAVLLLALGSDYTIFGVGHVWDEARRRPLRTALLVGVPRTARAITAAGIILATSFGLLAIVPLRPFRELAFAMFIGILLDSIVVRSVLIPSVLTLLGPASGWPTRYLHDRRRAVPLTARTTR